MAGYTRQSSASIVTGEDILAAPVNAEFNQLQSAFHASDGHLHTGGTGDGPPIELSGSDIGVTGQLGAANGGGGGTTYALSFANLKQDATTAATGVVELATEAEVETGTDATRVVTVATMTNVMGFKMLESGTFGGSATKSINISSYITAGYIGFKFIFLNASTATSSIATEINALSPGGGFVLATGASGSISCSGELTYWLNNSDSDYFVYVHSDGTGSSDYYAAIRSASGTISTVGISTAQSGTDPDFTATGSWYLFGMKAWS